MADEKEEQKGDENEGERKGEEDQGHEEQRGRGRGRGRGGPRGRGRGRGVTPQGNTDQTPPGSGGRGRGRGRGRPPGRGRGRGRGAPPANRPPSERGRGRGDRGRGRGRARGRGGQPPRGRGARRVGVESSRLSLESTIPEDTDSRATPREAWSHTNATQPPETLPEISDDAKTEEERTGDIKKGVQSRDDKIEEPATGKGQTSRSKPDEDKVKEIVIEDAKADAIDNGHTSVKNGGKAQTNDKEIENHIEIVKDDDKRVEGAENLIPVEKDLDGVENINKDDITTEETNQQIEDKIKAGPSEEKKEEKTVGNVPKIVEEKVEEESEEVKEKQRGILATLFGRRRSSLFSFKSKFGSRSTLRTPSVSNLNASSSSLRKGSLASQVSLQPSIKSTISNKSQDTKEKKGWGRFRSFLGKKSSTQEKAKTPTPPPPPDPQKNDLSPTPPKISTQILSKNPDSDLPEDVNQTPHKDPTPQPNSNKDMTPPPPEQQTAKPNNGTFPNTPQKTTPQPPNLSNLQRSSESSTELKEPTASPTNDSSSVPQISSKPSPVKNPTPPPNIESPVSLPKPPPPSPPPSEKVSALAEETTGIAKKDVSLVSKNPQLEQPKHQNSSKQKGQATTKPKRHIVIINASQGNSVDFQKTLIDALGGKLPEGGHKKQSNGDRQTGVNNRINNYQNGVASMAGLNHMMTIPPYMMQPPMHPYYGMNPYYGPPPHQPPPHGYHQRQYDHRYERPRPRRQQHKESLDEHRKYFKPLLARQNGVPSNRIPESNGATSPPESSEGTPEELYPTEQVVATDIKERKIVGEYLKAKYDNTQESDDSEDDSDDDDDEDEYGIDSHIRNRDRTKRTLEDFNALQKEEMKRAERTFVKNKKRREARLQEQIRKEIAEGGVNELLQLIAEDDPEAVKNSDEEDKSKSVGPMEKLTEEKLNKTGDDEDDAVEKTFDIDADSPVIFPDEQSFDNFSKFVAEVNKHGVDGLQDEKGIEKDRRKSIMDASNAVAADPAGGPLPEAQHLSDVESSSSRSTSPSQASVTLADNLLEMINNPVVTPPMVLAKSGEPSQNSLAKEFGLRVPNINFPNSVTNLQRPRKNSVTFAPSPMNTRHYYSADGGTPDSDVILGKQRSVEQQWLFDAQVKLLEAKKLLDANT